MSEIAELTKARPIEGEADNAKRRQIVDGARSVFMRPLGGGQFDILVAGYTYEFSTGKYRIALAPGRWSLRVKDAHFGAKPTAVWVPTGRYAKLNVFVDTGIR